MRKRLIIASLVLLTLVAASAIGFYLFGAVGLFLGIGAAVVAIFGSSAIHNEFHAKNALWEADIHKRSGQDFRGRFKQ